MSRIYVVGIGPGAYDQMTGRAIRALNDSDVIIGYTVYVDLPVRQQEVLPRSFPMV